MHENGLDTGRAERRKVHADAMWLPQHWATVLSQHSSGLASPRDIRQACRDAGYARAIG